VASSPSFFDLEAALERCASEPIQRPGSIQPEGFLLAFEQGSMTVVQASANVRTWLGVHAQALLGQTIDDLIADGSALIQRMDQLDEESSQPLHVGNVHFRVAGGEARPLSMMFHRTPQALIAEFEAPTDSAVGYTRLYPLVRSFISHMNETETVDDLCRRSIREIKRLSGFGRIMTYSFDEAGNGLVNAEEADEGYDSYLGLSFPASDIPAQARELYRLNRIRVISNVDYQSSALVSAPASASLDLSYAALRSVSPVHLQYMRNMGTAASMSVSIIVKGKLWGLISCHNRQPMSVDFHTRTACELLGRVLSMQIETKLTDIQNQRMLELRHRVVHLLAAMADRDGVIEGIRALPERFVRFVDAQGGAVVFGSMCDVHGTTPDLETIQALAHWLGKRHDDTVFHTDNVSRDIPQLPALAEHCGGLLAVAISSIHSHYLIWFKPELNRVVNWAGRPDKAISDDGSLNPRRSFDQWQEIVQGYSAPWPAFELDAVAELRFAVLGIVLRKAEELAALAESLEKSNRELESFSYSVSHDLRAPLRHIAGYAELLSEMESSNLTERGARFLGNIEDSARFAGALVDNLLSFSQMGRSAMHMSDVNLTAMVESVRREMLPDYEGRQIDWRVQPLPIVFADAALLHLAMRNLISNAIKYSRNQAEAVIEIGSRIEPGRVVIYIKDNGAGFDPIYADKLFGVFQRLHRDDEFEGLGIGLATVKRIIERHDGELWADGTVGKGATFFFSLPSSNQGAA